MSEVNEPVVIGSVEEFERAYGPRQSLAALAAISAYLDPNPPPSWWRRLARRLLRRPEPAPLAVARVLGPDGE